MTNTFNIAAYEKTINTFPQITYDQFSTINRVKTRREIVKNNKILKTDAYNRTMTDLRGEDGMKEEVFTLAFRKNAAKEYTIIYGIKDKLLELFGTPITQHELDFAEAHFNAQKKK
jgi:nicotinic acid phosphoribosyltransferase